MKDPSKLISPRALSKQRHRDIAKMVEDRPDLTYAQIGERFGVSHATVSRIAYQHGVARKVQLTTEKKSHKPDKNRREGGVIATDAQWRARQDRIG